MIGVEALTGRLRVPKYTYLFPHCNRIGCAGIRYQSTTTGSQSISQQSQHQQPASMALDPRWLSNVKRRIGKCITFGMKSPQVATAGAILAEIVRDWRELVAGSEGFLTDTSRRGLYRHQVVWGDMDSMVSPRSKFLSNLSPTPTVPPSNLPPLLLPIIYQPLSSQNAFCHFPLSDSAGYGAAAHFSESSV